MQYSRRNKNAENANKRIAQDRRDNDFNADIFSGLLCFRIQSQQPTILTALSPKISATANRQEFLQAHLLYANIQRTSRRPSVSEATSAAKFCTNIFRFNILSIPSIRGRFCRDCDIVLLAMEYGEVNGVCGR